MLEARARTSSTLAAELKKEAFPREGERGEERGEGKEETGEGKEERGDGRGEEEKEEEVELAREEKAEMKAGRLVG